MIRAAKFPPKGGRGMSGYSFSGGWSAKSGPDWIEWSNRDILVGVMRYPVVRLEKHGIN